MILFFWEPIRLDLIALSIPVILIIFQKWTKISVEEALSGFSSKATLTVLAMYMLSTGIYRSGLIQILGEKFRQITGDNQTNLMVYGSGGYKFKDFFMAGAPLQLLLAILTPLFVSIFWPL